jgi:hypothetical protein
VFFHYVAEGDREGERYRLTSTVPALRERELVGVSTYQRLFRQRVTSWFPPSEAGQLGAELFSAAIVAAHNRVLRRWLRGEDMDPHVEIDAALTTVRETFEHRHQDTDPIVLVLPASMKTSDMGDRPGVGLGKHGREAGTLQSDLAGHRGGARLWGHVPLSGGVLDTVRVSVLIMPS